MGASYEGAIAEIRAAVNELAEKAEESMLFSEDVARVSAAIDRAEAKLRPTPLVEVLLSAGAAVGSTAYSFALMAGQAAMTVALACFVAYQVLISLTTPITIRTCPPPISGVAPMAIETLDCMPASPEPKK